MFQICILSLQKETILKALSSENSVKNSGRMLTIINAMINLMLDYLNFKIFEDKNI